MSNTELIRRLRRLQLQRANGSATIFKQAADALVQADLELQEARELGERITELAQTVKRMLRGCSDS